MTLFNMTVNDIHFCDCLKYSSKEIPAENLAVHQGIFLWANNLFREYVVQVRACRINRYEKDL